MTEKRRISVNFENGRNSTNFPFMAASTPISVAKNGHADVCSQKQRRPQGKPEHSRRRKTTPIAGKSQQEREIVSGRNNAQGPRRGERRRNERSFSMADTATQKDKDEKGEEGRYEGMLEYLDVNVKRARRPSSGVFEVS